MFSADLLFAFPITETCFSVLTKLIVLENKQPTHKQFCSRSSKKIMIEFANIKRVYGIRWIEFSILFGHSLAHTYIHDKQNLKISSHSSHSSCAMSLWVTFFNIYLHDWTIHVYLFMFMSFDVFLHNVYLNCWN
jgi:hypothetical protein